MKLAEKVIRAMNEISDRIKITHHKERDKYTTEVTRKNGKKVGIGASRTSEEAEESGKKALEKFDAEDDKKSQEQKDHEDWNKVRVTKNKMSMQKHGKVKYGDKEIYGDDAPKPKTPSRD